jgi:non-heme chloroperoxidase
MRTGYLDVPGGVRLVYDEYGPRDAEETVVLLHGGAQTRRAWAEVGERLAGLGWRAICPDLRGHGESSWSASGDYSVAAVRADAIRLARHVGAPVHLVGASLGGLVSILLAADRPELVRTLTLVDVVDLNNPAGEDRVRDFLAASPTGFSSLDEVADAVAAYQSHRPRPADTSGLASYVRPQPGGTLRWHWDPEFLLKDGLPWTRRRRRALATAAESLTVPTLLLVGGLSDILDEAALERFARQVPHARVIVIPDAHHMISGDRNEEFGDEVVRFVGEHRSEPVPTP